MEARMRIVEDKDDRERLFHRITSERFAVRPKGYEAAPVIGWPRKHQLWPCVRKGAGEVWLDEHEPSPHQTPEQRRRALLFLRGHSHEALMTEGQSLVFIYQGVGNEVDEWTGERDVGFTEIKSTAISSARMWPIVKAGKVDILEAFSESFFSGWFQQCCQNCVATNIKSCRLRVFFMNGEYGERRKKCPECEAPLGQLHDAYKQCTKCGYKAYSTDLRSYILTFTDKELAWHRKEVFSKRRDQFNLAKAAESKDEFLMRAEPTKCFLCKGCGVGQRVGCAEYVEPKR